MVIVDVGYSPSEERLCTVRQQLKVYYRTSVSEEDLKVESVFASDYDRFDYLDKVSPLPVD